MRWPWQKKTEPQRGGLLSPGAEKEWREMVESLGRERPPTPYYRLVSSAEYDRILKKSEEEL